VVARGGVGLGHWDGGFALPGPRARAAAVTVTSRTVISGGRSPGDPGPAKWNLTPRTGFNFAKLANLSGYQPPIH
jgi:hypothetical protein